MYKGNISVFKKLKIQISAQKQLLNICIISKIQVYNVDIILAQIGLSVV